MTHGSVEERIETYGGEILRSELFAQARSQRHHVKTTIAEHSLRVAQVSLRLCGALERLGISFDERVVVQGALCHDLGLVDRDHAFSGGFDRTRRHPMESARLAGQLLPELDARTRLVIERHMFPVLSAPPTSREGVAVMLADKYVSIREMLSNLRQTIEI